MLVFVPGDVPSSSLQRLLSGAMPAIDVVVVERFRDFERGLSATPDAVLTLPVVLEAVGLSGTLSGKTSAGSDDSCALVAVGREVIPSEVESVGAVAILGRQGMKELVSRLVGGSPRVERVSSFGSLLTLLQLERVEAVLLPERLVDSLRAPSKLDLRVSRIKEGVGLPVLAVSRNAGVAVVQSIKALGPVVSRWMGAQTWE